PGEVGALAGRYDTRSKATRGVEGSTNLLPRGARGSVQQTVAGSSPGGIAQVCPTRGAQWSEHAFRRSCRAKRCFGRSAHHGPGQTKTFPSRPAPHDRCWESCELDRSPSCHLRSVEMNREEKAKRFARLHVKGAPLLLYNAWDAGSARSVLEAGAKAIATSSWSVAAAQGYQDGEAIPIEFVEEIVGRIAASVDAPVTVDFEGGYSADDSELADNISRLIDLGVIGINFEDRVVKGSGLYSIDRQVQRLGAIRNTAEQKRVDLFVNARTDV